MTDINKISMTKRIISILCAFVMCVAAFGGTVGHYVNAAESAANEYSEIIEILKLFKIADDTVTADAFDPNATVTRGEFAQYAVKMLNISTGGNTELYYNDVPSTFYAYDEITAMTKAGYMSGVGDKRFEPDGAMLAEYTYKIFLKALGFGGADDVINDPVNAANTCHRIGVFDGVNQTTGELKAGNLYKMIYNTLFIECYVTNGKEITRGDETFMEVTRNMKYVENGTVTCVNGMSIDNETQDDDVVIIDSKKYKAPSFNIDETLGRNVRFIYSVSRRESDDKDKIVWIKPSSSSDVLEIDIDPDCSFDKSSGKLTYIDKNGNEKSVYIPENISMIYNGKFRESDIKEVFAKTRYKLTLIKTNSAYKTAIVWDYKNIVADEISTLNYSVKDKSSGEIIELDENKYDKMTIVGSDGSPMSFDGISKGDVLSVYITYDKTKIKVVVCSEKEESEIKAVYSADGKVETSNRTLEFYDGDFKQKAQELGKYLGKTVTLMLDAKGFIADYELSAKNGISVGFLINAAVTGDSIGENIEIKMLKDDSTVKIMKCVDGLRIDDVKYTDNARGAYAALCGGKQAPTSQMIGYTQNSDGEITKIYTAKEADDKNSQFTVNKRLVSLEGDESEYDYAYYNKSSARIGRVMAVNGNTKIFIVPEESVVKTAEDKYFRVGSIEPGTYKNTISYRTTLEPTFFEQYVLIRTSSSESAKMSEYAYMFDCVIDSLDSDGYEVKIARVYDTEGNVRDLEIADDFDFEANGYKRGDLFIIGQNEMTQELTKTETIYQPSKNIIVNKGTTTEEYRTVVGYTHKTDTDGVSIGYTSGAREDEVINMTGGGVGSVIIYDKERDEIFVGTTADLKSYSAYGDDCSPVVASTWYQAARGLFGYR